jgi:hypothetical protein
MSSNPIRRGNSAPHAIGHAADGLGAVLRWVDMSADFAARVPAAG